MLNSTPELADKTGKGSGSMHQIPTQSNKSHLLLKQLVLIIEVPQATGPKHTTAPPVMYSQQWSPTPSTTAMARELRTANLSPVHAINIVKESSIAKSTAKAQESALPTSSSRLRMPRRARPIRTS
ncbi:MAG: hypothetical protein FRX49_06800 [Trebouxia sp. A1-2]|nr:MAG: hypothetical protein FRX49_06800 [Trebouxia sp. A1-2]